MPGGGEKSSARIGRIVGRFQKTGLDSLRFVERAAAASIVEGT